MTGKKSSKTYAEAVAVGLPVDMGQIRECAKPDEVHETEDYGPGFMDECFPLYSESKDNELCYRNVEVAEPLVDIQVSCVAAVEFCGLEVVENTFDSVSGDSTELCAVKDTFQGADTWNHLLKKVRCWKMRSVRI